MPERSRGCCRVEMSLSQQGMFLRSQVENRECRYAGFLFCKSCTPEDAREAAAVLKCLLGAVQGMFLRVASIELVRKESVGSADTPVSCSARSCTPEDWSCKSHVAALEASATPWAGVWRASSTERGEQLEQDCSGRTAVSQCCLLTSPAATSCSNPAELSPSRTRLFEPRAWSVMDGCGGGHECGSCMPLRRPRLVPSSKALNPDGRPGFWCGRWRQSPCHQLWSVRQHPYAWRAVVFKKTYKLKQKHLSVPNAIRYLAYFFLDCITIAYYIL